MGTFIIRPTHLISGGGTFAIDGVPFVSTLHWESFSNPNPAYASILAAMLDYVGDGLQGLSYLNDSSATPETGGDTLRFQAVGACIYLDGSLVPIAFSSLPSGFTVTAASVKISQNIANPIIVQPPIDGTAHFFLQQGNGNDGPQDASEFPYSGFPFPSMLTIQTNGMGVRTAIVCNAVSDPAGIAFFYGLSVEGIYTIVSQQWAIQNPSNPVQIGDEVTLIGEDADEIKEIELEFENSNGDTVIVKPLITFQSPISLTFVIPGGLGNFQSVSPVIVTIRVTTFGGTTTLGDNLILVFSNPSGIYTLVNGKRSDTIYVRTSNTAVEQIVQTIPGEIVLNELINEEETDLINQFNTINGVQSLLGLIPLLEPESEWEFNPYQFQQSLPSLVTRITITTPEIKIPNPLVRTAFIGG